MAKTQILLASLTAIALSFTITNLAKSKTNSLSGLNTTQLIKAYGYAAEEHIVQTEDGYILTLHRLPPKASCNQTLLPALLMHGMLNSAADFIAQGPRKSLGCILADACYDVWIGNSRGTTWSAGHATLHPESKKFWNFSLHEMGIYDVPAKIDYVLQATNSTKLHYVGYSQGSIEIFVLLSTRPEYSRKISLISAMAPAIFVENITNTFIRFLIYTRHVSNAFFEYANVHHFSGPKTMMNGFLRFLCAGNKYVMPLCKFGFAVIQGSSDRLDDDFMPILTTNTPGGIGSKQFTHILQIGAAGYATPYDYGTKENFNIYGQAAPPKYNFSLGSAPLAVYYSADDQLVDAINIKLITKYYPNIVRDFRIEEPFHHMDFMWANNAARLLYYPLVEEMSKYNNK